MQDILDTGGKIPDLLDPNRFVLKKSTFDLISSHKQPSIFRRKHHIKLNFDSILYILFSDIFYGDKLIVLLLYIVKWSSHSLFIYNLFVFVIYYLKLESYIDRPSCYHVDRVNT